MTRDGLIYTTEPTSRPLTLPDKTDSSRLLHRLICGTLDYFSFREGKKALFPPAVSISQNQKVGSPIFSKSSRHYVTVTSCVLFEA